MTQTIKPLEWLLLGVILLLYGGLATAFAIRTPDWQVPDETAHYSYIQQIAETGEIPVIEQGDWVQEYQVMLTTCAFHPAVTTGDPSRADNIAYLDACGYDPAIARGIETVQYEDHQPPLYYLLQTPVYSVSDGDLTTMRLFSAMIGVVAVVCAWGVVRVLFSGRPWLALSAAAFVAFLPQRLSIMAGVSNDSLAEALAGVVLLGVALYLVAKAPSWRWLIGLGIVVGLVFLTKTTVYYVSGIAGVAVLLRWWREKWPLRVGVRQVAALAIPALMIGAVWWVHSIDKYGGVDFLGLQRHDEVVVGQPRTNDFIDDVYGGSERVWLENMARTTFNSFWGQFGWMAFPMQDNIYRGLQVLVAVTLVGAVIMAVRQRWPMTLERWQREYLLLLGLALTLVFTQFFLYNLSFVQFQGRYLYPALIPLALLVALGIDGWVSLVAGSQKRFHWVGVGVALLLVLFAVYTLRNVITAIPDWS
jgi:4-amino-4-deoxy-L-arabinose transferase-like glycosyltransferase